MKALMSVEKGPPESLRMMEVAAPEPKAGEIRIAVKACGINFPDVLVIEDLYQTRVARPFAPGAEVSGVIDALGEGVEGFAIGDRVVGGGSFGGLAEKMTIKAQRCFKIPDSMPFTEAAALLMTYGTSYHALVGRGTLQAGESLLVLGAAGGVGLAAVEIGKALGARVIAAVSSEAKAEVARARGADVAIIYPRDSNLDKDAAKALSEEIRQAAGGAVDVIYDGVGGGYAEPSLRAINWGGRYLVVGFPAGIPSIALNLPLLKVCSVIGVFWGSFIERYPEKHRADIAQLMAWYEAGKIKPLVSETYPLEQGGAAIAKLSSRQAVGKVVVTIA